MAALAIRDDVAPDELRRRARHERDGRVGGRLIALANALDGMDRATAARLAGMDRGRPCATGFTATMRKGSPGYPIGRYRGGRRN